MRYTKCGNVTILADNMCVFFSAKMKTHIKDYCMQLFVFIIRYAQTVD